jgi:Tfp pilus assembly protein PilZ
MVEKRRYKRYPRRLSVKYGEKDLSRNGFTRDVSSTGIFVVAQQFPPIDSRLHMQIFIDAMKFVFVEGVVKRHKMVPPQMRQVEPAGFGIRFLSRDELLSEIVPRVEAELRLECVYHSKDDLVRAYQREMKFGGVFVHTDQAIPRDSKVVLEVRLDYAREKFVFGAKVIHVAAGDAPGQPKGVGVAFDDRAAVDQALSGYLNA